MRAALALAVLLPSALQAAEPGRYAWREEWPKFRTSEYVLTGVSLAGAAANFYLVPPPKSSSWRGGILFDNGARNTLMVRSRKTGDQAEVLGDLLTFPLIGYSMLDGPVTARWAGGDKETAFQLALINAQTFAVTEVLNLSVSNALPRNRPPGAVCDPASKYDPKCVKSFWSGHSANVFAAASLVCAQHRALPLYGGAADGVACGSSLAVASVVAVLRIVSNDHYASDIMVGAAVGGATGYLMPNLLHFRPASAGGGAWVPALAPGGGSLRYVKRW